MMDFCLLGPMVVRSAGSVLPIQPGKQRVLLATLLLTSNVVVPHDEIAEALWEDQPPPSARVTTQNYVKRLRKALGDTDRRRISTHARGYQITVDDGELDVLRFKSMLATARRAAREGSWRVAACRACGALRQWRGSPLADVGSDLLALRAVPPLAEMRLQAIELRLEADLRLGRHADLISELRQLTALHPIRERLHALLMRALCADGREGEALAAYQDARRALVSELGAEPGRDLQHLHQRILLRDPTLATPAGAW